MKKNPEHLWKQVTLRPRKDSRLGEILQYIDETKFEELEQAIKTLLRAVFSVPALKGKVTQEQLEKIGHECIGVLQGYINGIGKQAQISNQPAIAPSPFPLMLQSTGPANGNNVSASAKDENHFQENTESAVDKANRRLEMTDELFSH